MGPGPGHLGENRALNVTIASPVPPAVAEQPLLTISGLHLALRGQDGRIARVLHDVSLALARGECVGVAGESGSGKTVLAMTVLGLLPPSAIAERRGSVCFAGDELLSLSGEAWRRLRGQKMAMVFQEPMTALNPLLTIGEQIRETAWAHGVADRTPDGLDLATAVLGRVGFADPDRWVNSYPHQLSGGMRQRAMMAIALALDPDLVLADEPTTALDAGLQVQVIRELRASVVGRGKSLLFISHDLGVLAHVADRLAILSAGQLLELGPTAALMRAPRHPYTAALLAALPRLVAEKRLPAAIPGRLPHAGEVESGCVFAPRCAQVEEACRTGEIAWRDDTAARRGVRCRRPLAGA